MRRRSSSATLARYEAPAPAKLPSSAELTPTSVVIHHCSPITLTMVWDCAITSTNEWNKACIVAEQMDGSCTRGAVGSSHNPGTTKPRMLLEGLRSRSRLARATPVATTGFAPPVPGLDDVTTTELPAAAPETRFRQEQYGHTRLQPRTPQEPATTPGAAYIRAPQNRSIGTHRWYPHCVSLLGLIISEMQ